MKCIAEYHLRSDYIVGKGIKKLHVTDPVSGFECFIANLASMDDPKLPRLSAEIIFETPSLKAAQEIGWEHLLHAMNILAFATNSRVEYERIVRIVDWRPQDKLMRECFIFEKWDPDGEPIACLTDHYAKSVEALLKANPAPWLRQALRWFRLGIGEELPDDKYQLFWFALEITAEAKKPTKKVNDSCPKCRGNLYCEKCQEYPMHRPYARQAMRHLVGSTINRFGEGIIREMDDDLIERIRKLSAADVYNALEKIRNALMHGTRLTELKHDVPLNGGELTDLLGKITWFALLQGFPEESFSGAVSFIQTSTYSRHHVQVHAHISTVIPADADGSIDLSRPPVVQMSIVRSNKPSSSETTDKGGQPTT